MLELYNFISKYFTAIAILIIILVFYVGYVYLIDPKLQEIIPEIQQKTANQENVLKNQREKLKQMNENLDFFKQMSIDDMKRPAKIIPDKYPKEKLLGEIEDLILQNGFLFSGLAIKHDEELISSPNIGTINIQFVVNNINYAGMKSFLNTLEKNLPLMDIIFLNFSPSSENLSLSINTYYFVP